MDKKIADKWVEVLRSGKYKQGRGILRSNDNTWCCLGVLCDISNEAEWVHHPDGSNTYLDEAGALPMKLIREFDMTTPNGQICIDPDNYGSVSLAGLNDNGFCDGLYRSEDTGPLTFDEIADVIQMAWEGL